MSLSSRSSPPFFSHAIDRDGLSSMGKPMWNFELAFVLASSARMRIWSIFIKRVYFPSGLFYRTNHFVVKHVFKTNMSFSPGCLNAVQLSENKLLPCIKKKIHYLFFLLQSPSLGNIWKQSLITGPEPNPVKSFLGRPLKLDHKSKAQRNCSQILAHPMDAAAWARLIESPSTLCCDYLPVKPKSSLRSSWWYRRGMRNCSGSRGTLVSHPSHLLMKGNPTWGEEVTDFLAKYPVPAAAWGTSGERWTCLALVCILSASSALRLGCALAYKDSPWPAKWIFPFRFPSLLYLGR